MPASHFSAYRRVFSVCLAIVMAGLSASLSAQEDSARVSPKPLLHEYTEQSPLIYEDCWDRWPYSFLDDNGRPAGYNIDVVSRVLKELNIPFRIKLKQSNEVFEDLKNGRSDLTLGLAAGFHDQYGSYGDIAITLYTQSVVTPKNKLVVITKFKDLATNKVIVNENSFCHHLMLDYGWGDNAIPTDDMREAIQRLSDTEEGCIVWNNKSLEWLLEHYHIENLVLTPVNMPHGELKFMSNDLDLLKHLDRTFSRLQAEGAISPIQNRWFYPNLGEGGLSEELIVALVLVGVLILISLVYAITYNIQARRLNRFNHRRNRRLALILQSSRVRLWTYYPLTNTFAWRNDDGTVAYTYTMEEFARRYSEDDFHGLHKELTNLALSQKPDEGEVDDISITLRARDVEGGDTEDRDYNIVLSVHARNREGLVVEIIGTKKDITTEQEAKREQDIEQRRYWSMFHTRLIGVLLFDTDGKLININERACFMFECDHDEIINEGVSISDLFDSPEMDYHQLDGYYATQVVNIDKLSFNERKVKSVKRTGMFCNEFTLMNVIDDEGQPLGTFAICQDVTIRAIGKIEYDQKMHEVSSVSDMVKELESNIRNVLSQSGVRQVSYSPRTHTLTIFNSDGSVQYSMTQTRCMTLIDERYMKLVMRTISDMDSGLDKDVNVTLCSTLRDRARRQLCLTFRLMPVKDDSGEVTEYLGICLDRSEMHDIQKKTAIEAAKVQEVENTKNSFIRNMVQEIKNPMGKVVDLVSRLDATKPTADEPLLRAGIMENSDKLLHLIENILMLSRLEANMVEMKKREHNVADMFDYYCLAGINPHLQPGVKVYVDNPFKQLVLDIDAEHLGQAITHLASNAAKFTTEGFIRCGLDYTGEMLTVYVDDSGKGMSEEQLHNFEDGGHDQKGLGLAICRQIVTRLGGKLSIVSKLGQGTTVYITVPCEAKERLPKTEDISQRETT